MKDRSRSKLEIYLHPTNMSRRLERATELIKRELAAIITKEVSVSKSIITLTRVEVSDDLLHAGIYFVSIPDKQAQNILNIFQKNIFLLQQALNKRLHMRPVPKISFYIDRQEEEAAKIDELLGKI